MLLSPPFFVLLRGPDPSRIYAHRHDRWTVHEFDSGGQVIARLVTKTGISTSDLISIFAIPLAIISLGTLAAVWSGQFWLVGASVAAGSLPAIVISLLHYHENVCCAQRPKERFVFFADRSCALDDRTLLLDSTEQSYLQYTLHTSKPGWSGAESQSSFSELDFISVRDDKELVCKLIAHQNDWCLKHAKKLSETTGLPLKRKAIAQ